MTHSRDVIIIGSGISCLTTAAILARRGKSVIVLEKHTKPGGYLHCFKRFGSRFDTGAHYVGAMNPGEAFHALLTYLGVYDPDLFIPLDPEGYDELHFPSFQTAFRAGYRETTEALTSLFPREREGIERYFEGVSRTARLFPTYEYRDEYDETELRTALETPLSDVVNRCVRDPKLRAVLFAHCCLHGTKPSQVCFGFHALVTDSLMRGVFGFRHGGDALALRYVKVIEENGGKVFTRCGVKEIRAKDAAVTEVITERGESFSAEWVISGLHPKTTFRLVKDAHRHFRPAFLGRVENLVESPALMGVYAVCPDLERFRRNRNYYFFRSEDPETMFETLPRGHGPGAVFAARAEREDPKSGALVFHSAGPHEWFEPWRESRFGKRHEDYERFKTERGEELIEFVGGFSPDLRAGIEKFCVSTSLTNLHFNGSEEGSAYGILHSLEQTGVRALGPRTHLRNLLLTGQSTLFPGLLGAAIAGLRTAGSIIGIKEILRDLREIRESQ